MEERRKAGVQHKGAAYCSVEDCLEPVDSKGFCSRHYQADYHRRNRDKRLAKSKAYRAANLEQVKAQKRVYYHAHKDDHRRRSTAWKTANRERHLESMRAWGAANRARKKMLEAVRQERQRANGIFEVTTADLLSIHRRQAGACFYCQQTSAHLEWDHVIPISRGGRHSVGNLVAACRDCNASKAASYVTEWRVRVARLARPGRTT